METLNVEYLVVEIIRLFICLIAKYEINEIEEMFWMIFENIQISLVLDKWKSGKKCKS